MLAQLLSDSPRIPIRFAVFAGTDKTSTMYSVREFGDMCLLLALDKVIDYGGTLMCHRRMNEIVRLLVKR